MDFVPQSQHPSHIIPNAQCHPQLSNAIPNAKCHPESSSGSHHSSTKPLIPGFPIRSSSSSSQAPPAVDCSAGPPIASTPQRVFAQNRMCKNVHLNRKPIFFLRSESRRSRLTRVPCRCKRFSYTIKMCVSKFTSRFRKVIQLRM